MKAEPALIVGALIALLNAVLTVSGTGGFDDGLQWEDIVLILGPFLGALGIRTQVTPTAKQSRVSKV